MPQASDFMILVRPPLVAARRRREVAAEPYHLREAAALAVERCVLPLDDRAEPSLADVPFIVEFEEPERLDPDRVGLIPDEPPPTRQNMRLRAPLGSLGIHVLTLMLLLTATATAPDVPQAIPISLVLEAPPPEPAPAPAPPKPEAPPREPGPLASESFGNPQAGPTDPGKHEDRPAAAAAAPKLVAPPPPPPPPPPKPTPPQEQVAAISLPKPVLPAPPAAKPASAAPHRPAVPHQGAHYARNPGPTATRDEYLAYLVSLTRQHLDLVPLSLVGNRSGETALNVVVLDDGTIERINVLQGSGYPEIDRHIEEMVAAVHRFPPLPQWFQGRAMELVFRLKFPEGLVR